jgi:bifunctional non-homologous end joining protein LigD
MLMVNPPRSYADCFAPNGGPGRCAGRFRLQIVMPCKWPPVVKHDGHRLIAILPGRDQLRLLSRNGYDRTPQFREPFRPLIEAGLPPMVLDGEIAVPDDRGVTHLDALSEPIAERRPERLAYFAFDLLHLDGHDLRRCPIEDRKMLLRDVIGTARCERIVYVDHVLGIGKELFEAARQIGAEGIVSKRRGSVYRGGESREWLKTKCSETGVFAITGFSELGEGRLDAVYIAEARDGVLCPAGQVRFGFAGKGLWHQLNQRRAGPAVRGFAPVWLGLVADIKFFGRHKGGSIRDGVILSVTDASAYEQGR